MLPFGPFRQRFEVLPGFGWDNLRNVNEGQVVNFNFSQCRTTDDGRFLLPDTVSAIPIKASRVQVFAELITHWTVAALFCFCLETSRPFQLLSVSHCHCPVSYTHLTLPTIVGV